MMLFSKKRILIAALIVSVLCAVLFAAWTLQRGKDEVDLSKPVALVNGSAITLKDLNRELDKVLDGYAMQGQGIFPEGDRLEELRTEVLEQLIETELLWQESLRLGISVPDEQVYESLDKLKQQYINESVFTNAMALVDLTIDDMLFLIRKDLAISMLVQREISGVLSVSDQESEEFYRANPGKFEEPPQVRASHIFITVDIDATEADMEKAQALIGDAQRRLNEGEAFETLAGEISDCASAEKGGDVGFFARGDLDDAFEEAAFSMEINETSPVVRGSFGYHIIRVTERKPSRIVSFEEVGGLIESHLMDKKIHEGITRYLEDLKQRADIVGA